MPQRQKEMIFDFTMSKHGIVNSIIYGDAIKIFSLFKYLALLRKFRNANAYTTFIRSKQRLYLLRKLSSVIFTQFFQ